MSGLSHAGGTPVEIRHFRRHQHLVRTGDAPNAMFRIEDGWACRYQALGAGRRQITALFLPGEYCEPQWVLQPRTTAPVLALTSLRVRHFALSELTGAAPRAKDRTREMLTATLQILERQSDWIATLGRKTAPERLCALLCDVFARLAASGRVSDNSFSMPLTQADLADVVGLTPVHVNRVLKLLRTRGLIQLQAKRLRLVDPEALRAIGSALSASAGAKLLEDANSARGVASAA